MNVAIIIVPYDHDVARWGCATGPAALLDAGLADRIRDLGHRVTKVTTIELPSRERTRDMVTNLGRIGQGTSHAVAAALEADAFPLVLAGNCTHAVGAVGGLARAGRRPGIVWFDAHGDLHTYGTTETGFVGGMPFATCLGWDLDDWRDACGLTEPVSTEAAALIGASDLDPAEVEAISRHGVGRLDADALGGDGAATRAALAPRATASDAWYLHLDVDVVGDAVPGAFTPTDAPADPAAVEASIRAAVAAVPVQAACVATYFPAGDPTRAGVPFIFRCVDAILGTARS